MDKAGDTPVDRPGEAPVDPAGVRAGDSVFVEWAGTFRSRAHVETVLAGKTGPRLELRFPEKVKDSDPVSRPHLDQGVRVLRENGTSWFGVMTGVGEKVSVFEAHADDTAQRAFFRMPVSLRILLSPDEEHAFDSDVGSDSGPRGLRVLALLVELGGGGCRVSVPSGTFPKGTVLSGYVGLGGEQDPLFVRLLSLRLQPEGDRDSVACRFIDLTEPDRQRILRRLFDEYRRLRRRDSTESA